MFYHVQTQTSKETTKTHYLKSLEDGALNPPFPVAYQLHEKIFTRTTNYGKH
jgi:hypothetical protein